jgi:hypothetical protein
MVGRARFARSSRVEQSRSGGMGAPSYSRTRTKMDNGQEEHISPTRVSSE